MLRFCSPPQLAPIAGLLVSLVVAADARAQSLPPDEPVRMSPQLVQAKELPRVVVIAARNLRERSTRAIEAIRGQLTGIPATMLVEWVDTLEVTLPGQVRVAREVAKRTGAKMVLWADLSLPDQIFVYIGKGDAGRILVRSVRAEGSARGRLEAMSLIVRSSVQALAAGAQIGFLPPPASRPTKVVRPTCVARPPRRRTYGRLSGDVGYGLFALGSELSHGAQLGVRLRLLSWLRVGLAFRALQAVRVDSASVLLVLSRYPLGLDVSSRWRRGRWGLEGGVGLWAERLQWAVTPKRVEVTPSDETHRFTIAGQLFAGVQIRLIPSAALTLRVGVDLPNDARPLEVQGGVPERVVDPWPLQPWVLGGVRFALF